MTNQHGISTTRYYGQKFPGGLPYPSPTLVLDSADIRQQVRTLSHNSLQLRAIIERDVDTVIAQGLNLSPEPKYNILGLSPEEAKAWTSDVKERFELWAMDQRSNRSGRYNFFQAQRLMEKSKLRDGELFVALSYHNDPTLLSPLRFEILDPDQIRESGMTWTATGGSLQSPLNHEGITRNADGEEMSYKVWTSDATGLPKVTEIPRVGRNGRIMMLHALSGTDYAGQQRGISPLAICIQDLEHILNFTLAQVNKAINQSNVAFTVESETEQPAVNVMDYMTQGGVRRVTGKSQAVKEFGSDPKPHHDSKNVTPESLEPVYTSIPHGNFTHPGSYGIFSLPGKQKLKPFPDTSPSQRYDSFIDHYFAYIAATSGQSIETVLMRFRNNYSASRATLILIWRIAEQRRWELDYYILGPMYQMWLAEEIAAGRVRAPGWEDPRLRAAWTAHRYQGVPMPVIDPEKTMRAAKTAIELNSTTLEETAQEYNDSDFESNCVSNRVAYQNMPTPPWGFGGRSTGNNNNSGNNESETEEKSDEEEGEDS
jgi:capsid protein